MTVKVNLPGKSFDRTVGLIDGIRSLSDVRLPRNSELEGLLHLYAGIANEVSPHFSRRKPPKKALPEPTRKEAKATRAAAHAGRTSTVRYIVWRRSERKCESCGRSLLEHEGDLDHHKGGSLRRVLTTIENCRRLCRDCHADKTQNKPSRDWWERDFDRHLERIGYPARAGGNSREGER